MTAETTLAAETLTYLESLWEHPINKDQEGNSWLVVPDPEACAKIKEALLRLRGEAGTPLWNVFSYVEATLQTIPLQGVQRAVHKGQIFSSMNQLRNLVRKV